MTETRGLMLVMQTPKAGREDEHLEWYVSTHLPDVCAVPGAIRGELLVAQSPDGPPQWTRAAAYWTSINPAEFLGEVFKRAGSGEWQLSDSLDPEQTMMTIAEPIGPRVCSDEPDAEPADRLLFVVLTNAVAGEDDVFNEWYSNRHIPDVIAVPGFVAAQRFRFLSHPALGPCPYGYAALYEVRASAAEAAFAELTNRAGTELMVLSPTLAMEPIHAVPFAPVAIHAGTSA